jgi:hypothetical protein
VRGVGLQRQVAELVDDQQLGFDSASSFSSRRRSPYAVQRARYMTLETIAPLSDDPAVSLPAIAG